MTNATLSLQSNSNKTELTNADKKMARGAGGSTTSLAHQVSMSNELQLNGEDFVILPVNGKTPAFNKTNQPGLKPAPGSTVVNAYKAEKKTENEVTSTFATSLLGALFPMAGIMESLKHLMEVTHKLSDGNSISMKFSEVQNINPKDAINPNKAFIPVSPFSISNKPPMELWQVKRAKSKDEAEKKKKKLKGLGSF